MKFLETQQTPIEQLSYASESMLAALRPEVQGVLDVPGKLLGFIGGIAESFRSFSAPEKPQVTQLLSADQSRFLELLQQYDFTHVRQLRAFVPEGFQGSLVHYSEELAEGAARMGNLQAEVLRPYAVFVASLLSSNDLSRLINDNHHIYQALAVQRERDLKEINAFFKKGNHESQRLIGDVISRNSDWQDVFKNTQVATAKINEVNRDELQKLIAQASDCLDMVHQQLAAGKMTKLSAQSASALAEGAFQVASQLEYFSLLYYRITGLNSCLELTIKRVIAALK